MYLFLWSILLLVFVFISVIPTKAEVKVDPITWQRIVPKQEVIDLYVKNAIEQAKEQAIKKANENYEIYINSIWKQNSDLLGFQLEE